MLDAPHRRPRFRAPDRPARGARTTCVATVVVVLLGWLVPPAAGATDTRCIIASGGAATRCVRRYADALAGCRIDMDAECEAATRAPDGRLAAIVAASEKRVRHGCSAAAADALTSSLGIDDLVFRTKQACAKWGDDFADVVLPKDRGPVTPSMLACRRVVAAQLRRVREAIVRNDGRRCNVADFAGRRCDRAARDRRVAKVRVAVRHEIVHRCGTTFDQLGLASSASDATLGDRVDALAAVVASRSRHLALRVYPPLALGPTAAPGPHPVGVRTLALSDPSRSNPTGTGPRALVTEIYYPSTPDAIAGVARDVVDLLGIPLFPTPTYRDVARAPGRLPLLVYSPGGGEPRFVHLLLVAHLASHGYVVAAVDHQGNDLLDPAGDPDTIVNRPRDVSVLVDQLLAFDATPGDFLETALDADRIGMIGHSLGGYTAFALAVGPFTLGTFTDPRIRAIMPLDGSAQYFAADAPAIFGTIAVPTLLFGGSLSPFLEPLTKAVFDNVPGGPPAVAFADLRDAGHLTFTDICEVPDDLLTLAGGSVPFECGPTALPWRYARHVVAYLALNFFDAALRGDADALDRLVSERVATVEDLTLQTK